MESKVETIEKAEGLSRKKQWTIGTLTYTMSGLLMLFAWLLMGDFIWSLKDRSVATVIQLLFKNFGASDTLNALFMGSSPSFIALFLGPVISYCSDRHRGPYGRRIPYLLASTPVISLAMVGLAFSPALGDILHNALGAYSPGCNNLVISFLAIFWITFEVGTITANSIFAALVNDVVPHQFLGRFYGLFRIFSLSAGIIFNYWLLGKAEVFYMWIFIGFGALYAAGFLILCFKVKEGSYPAVNESEKRHSISFGVSTYFRECFRVSYYRWTFIAITLSWLSFVPVNLFSVFYAKSLDVDMNDYGLAIAITFTASLILSWPVGALTDRLHPLRMCMVSLFAYCVLAFLSGLFIQGKLTFFIAFVCNGVIAGMFCTAIASLGQRLYPIDKFAQFSSACGIVSSISTMLFAPLVGYVMDLLAHSYQWTYMMGAIVAFFALAANLIVYKKFLVLGGHTDYSPPGLA